MRNDETIVGNTKARFINIHSKAGQDFLGKKDNVSSKGISTIKIALKTNEATTED